MNDLDFFNMGPGPELIPYFVLIALLVVSAGVLALWRLHFAVSSRRPIAWILLGPIALVLLFGLGLSIYSVAIVVAGVLIFTMIAEQYRGCRRDMLLTMLLTAVERRMPLGPVLATFGSESIGWDEARERQMAEDLERGIPLDEALTRAGEALGASAGVLLRTGRQVGDVPGAIECYTHSSRHYRPLWTASAARFCYLIAIGVLVPLPIIFYLVFIVPALQKIFSEFDIQLPWMTQTVISASQYAPGWVILAVPAIFGLWLFATIRYVGNANVDQPSLGRWMLPFHSATILQALSLATQRGQPLEPTIELLARTYPRRSVRRRLSGALTRIEQGEEWLDGLRAARLLRASDVALLRVAQRVGNLPWAMRELADAANRRLVFRLQAISNVVFPLGLLGIAAMAAFAGISMLLPLIAMIQSLAQ